MYNIINDSPKSRLNKDRKAFHGPAKNGLDQVSCHDKRKFISHPCEFPIRYRRAQCSHSALNMFVENPFVGLSFQSNEAVESGTVLDVTIRVGCEDHTFQGQVVWTRQLGKCHELGMYFAQEDDAFRVRNLEQLCHIEAYRRRLCEIYGCTINIDCAAQEWIERFSAQFPKLFADS